MIVRRAADHQVVPWANGLGSTRVVARVPDDDATWRWRLSLADVVTDGPFSVLPGVDRCIAVASGAGMRLVVGGDSPVTLGPDGGAFAFPGDAETSCVLLDGPIVDLNLMLRRGRASGHLDVVTSESGRLLDVVGAVALVVLDGELTVEDAVEPVTLVRFDAVLLGASGGPAVRARTRARVALVHAAPPTPALGRTRT